jgi:putative transposase
MRGIRKGLAIEIDTSLTAERVIRAMEQLKTWRGIPQALRLDNGPELTAEPFVSWCHQHGIELRYIQPGKPTHNAYLERFNRSFRDEVLNAYLFDDLDQVREISHHWLIAYNERRPHQALGHVPPTLFRPSIERQTSPLQPSH